MDDYMDFTISIGDGLALYGRYSACIVEQNGVPMAERAALDDTLMGYGDTPLEAAANLVYQAAQLVKKRRKSDDR